MPKMLFFLSFICLLLVKKYFTFWIYCTFIQLLCIFNFLIFFFCVCAFLSIPFFLKTHFRNSLNVSIVIDVASIWGLFCEILNGTEDVNIDRLYYNFFPVNYLCLFFLIRFRTVYVFKKSTCLQKDCKYLFIVLLTKPKVYYN